MSATVLSLLILLAAIALLGFLTVDQAEQWVWMFFLPLGRTRCLAVGTLDSDVRLPPRGEWAGTVELGASGITLRYQGEFVRKGRVMLLWSWPKRDKQRQRKFKPAFNFG